MLGYAYFSLLSTYFDKIIIVFYDKRHKNFSFYQNDSFDLHNKFLDFYNFLSIRTPHFSIKKSGHGPDS